MGQKLIILLGALFLVSVFWIIFSEKKNREESFFSSTSPPPLSDGDRTSIERVTKCPAHKPISRKNKWLQNFFTQNIEQGTKLPDGGRGIFGPQNYATEIRSSVQDQHWHKNIRWMPELGSVWRGNAEGWVQPTQNPLETTRQQIQSADERRVAMTLIVKITRSDAARGLIAADVLWKYDIPSASRDTQFPNQHLEPVLIPAWGVAQPFKHNKFILVDSFGAEIKWKFNDKNKLSMTYFLGKTSNIVNVSREKIIHAKIVLACHCVRISPFKAPKFTRGEVLAAERSSTDIAGEGRGATLDQIKSRISSIAGILKLKIPAKIQKLLDAEIPTSDHEWYTRIVTLEGYVMRIEMMMDPLPPNENGLKIFDEWYKSDGKITLPEHGKNRLVLEDVRGHNALAAKDWGVGITKGHTGMIPSPKVGEEGIQTGNPVMKYPGMTSYIAHLSPSNETHTVQAAGDVDIPVPGVNPSWSYLNTNGTVKLTLKVLKTGELPQAFYTMSFHNLSSAPTSVTFGYGSAHNQGVNLYDVLQNCSSVSSREDIVTTTTLSSTNKCQIYNDPVSKTFTVQGAWILQPYPNAGLETIRLVIAGLMASDMFVRVSTPLNPDGEIRGQLLGSNVKPW